MDSANVFCAVTGKNNGRFEEDPGVAAKKYWFILHNEDRMEVAGEFDLQMIEEAL